MFNNFNSFQTKEKLNSIIPTQPIPQGKLIHKLAISNNNQMIAAANLEGKIVLWNISINEKQNYQAKNYIVHQLAFFHHDQMLVVASKEKTCFFFIKNRQKNVPFMIVNHQWHLFKDSLSETSTHIIQHYLTGIDIQLQKLKVWNLIAKKLILNQKFTYSLWLIEFSKHLNYLICSLSGGKVVIQSFNKRNILCEWIPHENCGAWNGPRTLFLESRNELITSHFEVKIWNFQALISGNKCSLIKILASSNGYYWDMYTDLTQQTLIYRDFQFINIWDLQTLQQVDDPQLNSICKFKNRSIIMAIAKNFQFIVHCDESNIIRICYLQKYDFNE